MGKGLAENKSWAAFEQHSGRPITKTQTLVKTRLRRTLYTDRYTLFLLRAVLEFWWQSFFWCTSHKFDSPFPPLRSSSSIATKERGCCLDPALCRNQCEPFLSAQNATNIWLPRRSYNTNTLFGNKDSLTHDLWVVPFIQTESPRILCRLRWLPPCNSCWQSIDSLSDSYSNRHSPYLLNGCSRHSNPVWACPETQKLRTVGGCYGAHSLCV